MGDQLYRFAMRFSRNHEEAEDIVQDVFLKLLNMGEKLDTYRNKEALAFTVTRNLCLDRIRTRHTVSIEDSGVPEKQEPDDPPDVRLDKKEKAGKILQIMEQLPEVQRTVLHMRDVEGLDFGTIAVATDMTVNNVRVVLSRARKKVKEMFLKQINDENRTGEKIVGEVL